VLSQMAGMSDEHIATLTAGDVAIADGAATITAAAGTTDQYPYTTRTPLTCQQADTWAEQQGSSHTTRPTTLQHVPVSSIPPFQGLAA
jgi:hypothetical protein